MSATFLREFAKSPSSVGAVAPSSRWLARCITDAIDIESANCVVEIGPGTGAFTGEILRRIKPGARFIAVERNPSLCTRIRLTFPAVSLHEASAVELPHILRAEGIDHADCIISGLPWAAFDDALQDALLDAIIASLRAGGRFATFAYLQGLLLPAGRKFRHKLGRAFPQVSRSRIIWRNIPPAFSYRCTKE